MNIQDPHHGQPVLRQGPDPSAARLAVVLVHGRGGSAADMLALARELDVKDTAYLAPQAAGSTWYPLSFLAPLADNEPDLSSALRVLYGLLGDLEAQQVPPERIALLGFSQGACLALEFAARRPQRYAAIVGLSGGLIGPPGPPRRYSGSVGGAPVFLGCSDVDPHIPVERVHESSRVFRELQGAVDERIYPRMGHAINADELDAVAALLARGPSTR
ncbi:MAG: phospholipase [Luteitalea sp.]|nr:phospholipase [Luteitalea sp.]